VKVLDADAHEGPVHVADEDAIYFTTTDGAVARLALEGERFPLAGDHVEIIRSPAARANGMTLGPDGRLLICEQGGFDAPARIAALDRRTGEVETVVDSWRGLPLNSPNDVVARADGTVWFTDPSYGHLQGFRPEPRVGDFVYRHDPRSGRTEVVADSFDKPNGIAFSPDERVLYVTDSGANQEAGSYHVDRPHHVRAFDVDPSGHLSGERLLAVTSPGFPDGLKVDSGGRVYVSAFSGVLVLSAAGDLLGEIVLPGAVNFCFGAARRRVLFITTDDAVWAAVLRARAPEPLKEA
jgi:gluconolactonase